MSLSLQQGVGFKRVDEDCRPKHLSMASIKVEQELISSER
jgi:hypothetical protein